MKKVLLLFAALFIGFSINAQNQKSANGRHLVGTPAPNPTKTRTPIPEGYARIILTAGDVWGDDTGYQMLLDSNATAYGTLFTATGPLSTSGDVPASTYAQFEYKIPVNADGSILTSNIVFNSSVSIDIPAGTYDYCITNPSPEDDVMWIANGEHSRADDYVFIAGYTYSYTMYFDSGTWGDNSTLEINTNAENDIEVVSITYPSAINMNLSNAEHVKAMIKNNGTASATGFDLQLLVGGAVVATESYSGTIASDMQEEYEFTTPVDLSMAGDYTITVIAALTGDEIATNDTVTKVINNIICDQITTFPWDEGFEGTTFPPTCWTSYNVDGGGTQWARNTSTTYVYTGTGSAGHIYSGAANQEGWLVTPQIDIPDEGYVIEFWTKTQFPGDNVYSGVWVSTTGCDPTTATFVEEHQLSGTEISATWKKITVLLDDYAGESIYIGFKYTGNNADSWYIDDVRVYNASSFVDVEVASITSPVSGLNLGVDTVKAIIKNNGVNAITDLDITLNVNGVETIETIPSLAAMSQMDYTFTQTVDLSAAGNYTISVYTSLANDQIPENDTATITVTNTICGLITSFPWEEGFENAVFPPYCWYSYNVDGGGSQWARNASATYIRTGTGSAVHSYGVGAQEGWLVTPQMEIPDEGYVLEFWNKYSYPGDNEYSGILVSTNGNDPATATFVEEYQLSGAEISSSWQKVTISLDDYVGESIYIGFKYMGTNADAWYIDDLRVYNAAAYIDVEVVSITSPVSGINLGTDTVKAIVKNNGGAAITNLDITLNVNGVDETTEVIPSIPAMSQITYTFTQTVDLSVAGNHVIKVYTSLANDQVVGNDTATVTITNTICGTIDEFPWSEGFESADFPPTCWTSYNVDGVGTQWARNTSATYVHTGTGSAVHNYAGSSYGNQEGWLVTPQMEIPDEGYVLEFWTKTNYPTSNVYSGILVSTNGYDPATATFVEEYQLSGTEVSSSWKKIIISLNDYVGDSICIGFKYMGTNADAWYIDDVKVYDFSTVVDVEIASITSPVSGINLGAAETVSAIIKNNGGSEITNLDVTLNLNGVDVATETVASIASLTQITHTFTQTVDLSAAGDYVITVNTSLTGDSNAQNDTATITISNTVCPIVNSFPWEEGFDDGISECWTNIDADGDGESWFRATLDGEPVVGSYSAIYYDLYGFFIDLTPDNYLITPQIALDANYALQFSVGGAHTSRYAEKFSVMVSTTGTNPADFTAIHTETLTEVTMKTVVLPLNAYTGDTVYIAFRHWDCTDNYVLIIDDVKIFDIEGMIDAEVASITHPSSGDLGTENVKAIIKNNGGADISNFTLTLNVNGTDVATETYTGTIASLDQDEYTFTQSYNFSNMGNYTITVSVNLANDTEPTNDACVKIVASAPDVTLYGYRIYDDGMNNETVSAGVISFGSNSPATVTEVSDYADGANTITGGEYYDGHLYLYSRTTSAPANFIKLSTTTWTATTTPISTICTDMAYDYSTNVMYGLASGTSTSNLNTINMTTGEITLVGDMGAVFFTLACNLQGDLFAINTNGDFCSINKTTGAATVINNTGIDPNYIQSMAFDHNTGRLFWAMCNVADDGKFVEIDPTSGAVIDRGVLAGNAEVVALYTPYTHSVITPIEIVSLSPERDAPGVEPTATVRVTFDGDIEVIDLSGVTISPNPGNVSASATGAVLTIAHDDFDHDTRYTVTVPAGAIDNYTSDSPITWSFTVKGSGVSTIDLKAINMYPNPAKNQVQLTNLPEKSNITVYDVTGRVVKTCTANGNSFTMSVDFAPGTYFVKIENNNASTVKKLIVE